MELSENVERLLRQRYYQPGEDWAGLVERVVENVCGDESGDFRYHMFLYIYDRIFLPNSPCLVNAGVPRRGMFACFVVGPEEDTLEAHAEALKDIAMVGKSGGGCGFTGSFIRAQGSPVAGSTHGYAYGPNNWAIQVNNYLDMITQGGFRKMALMYALSSEHPDLGAFIDLKQTVDETFASRFNQSVMATDAWMRQAIAHPDTTEAGRFLKKMAYNAWNNGEPGLLFDDTINNNSPYKKSGQKIYTPNPCVLEGTLVNTPFGMVPVESITPGDLVSTAIGSEPVASIEVHQNTPVFRVTFSDGGEQYVTAAHVYHIIQGGDKRIHRRRLDECHVGDYVQVLPSRLEHEGTDEEYRRGLMQGILLGDGCYTETQVSKHNAVKIATNKQETEYNDNLRSLFGTNRASYSDPNSNSMTIPVGNGRDLVASLALIPAYAHEKSLDITEVSSVAHAVGLLDGLLATDGNVHMNQTNPMIRWSTNSKGLATNIRQLLLMVGCHARVYAGDKGDSMIDGRSVSHAGLVYTAVLLGENLRRFCELSRIADLHPEKGERIRRLLTDYNLSGDTHKAQITGIEPAGSGTVYDLYCEDSDTWITEGYVQQGCGEQLLPSYGSCNLGSINLAHDYFYKLDGSFDHDRLWLVSTYAAQFLDDVGIKNTFPNEKFADWYKLNRPIGLGIMGYADALLRLGLTYGSPESLEFLKNVLDTMYDSADETSRLLGQARGVPHMARHEERRNITLLSIAPTGSISFIAECSSGIEPIFSPSFTRTDERGEKYTFVHPLAEEPFFRSTLNDDQTKVPTWQEHINVQAAAQLYVDSAVSKCLAKGTIIQTDHGLVRVEEFTNNHTPGAFTDVSGVSTSQGFAITGHYYNGTTPATTVRLSNGGRITGATKSHKILTTEGWKLLRTLKPGDYIVGSLTESHGPGGAPITWMDEFNNNANHLPTPTHMNVDLALWLGMVTADGSTVESSGATILTCADDEVQRVYSDLTKRIFGVTPKIIADSRTTNVRALVVTSRNLVRYVESLIGKGAFNKRVPAQILQGSSAEKVAYLSGVTLDGYVRRNKTGAPRDFVVYEGRSQQLAYEVFELCNSFGLYGTHMGDKPIYEPYAGFVYNVRLSGTLADLLSPIETHKQASVPEKKALVWVGQEQVLETSIPTADPRYYALRSAKQRKSSVCWEDTAQKMGWEYTGPVYKVTDVYEDEAVEMWDIEVEGSHSYITNGVVSHNTINLPNDATPDDVFEAFVYAWRTGCKGVTVYRDGSRQVQVLRDTSAKEREVEGEINPSTGWQRIVKTKPPRRPMVLPCDIVSVKVNAENWNILVGFLENDPYEVFAFRGEFGEAPGYLVKRGHGVYDLMGEDGDLILEDVVGSYSNDEEQALTRAISLALRHGADAFHVITQLDKAGGTITSFSRAIRRVLKKYVDEETLLAQAKCSSCGSDNTAVQEGCETCLDCGYSKCG